MLSVTCALERRYFQLTLKNITYSLSLTICFGFFFLHFFFCAGTTFLSKMSVRAKRSYWNFSRLESTATTVVIRLFKKFWLMYFRREKTQWLVSKSFLLMIFVLFSRHNDGAQYGKRWIPARTPDIHISECILYVYRRVVYAFYIFYFQKKLRASFKV